MTAPELWLHNPHTGELGHLTLAPEETGGLRMEGELWLQPGAAVLGEHVHSALTETFAVVEGKVGYTLDGVEGVAGPDETLRIPVGARHDWWNAGDGRAHVRFALDSADPAVPMAGRFFASIEAGWGLAAAGKTNARGMPTPLARLAGARVPGRLMAHPPAGGGADRAVRAAGAAGPGAGPRHPRTRAARRPLPGADPRSGRGRARRAAADLRLRRDRQPAVDDQRLTGDVGGLGAEQVQRGISDLPARPLAAGGDLHALARRTQP